MEKVELLAPAGNYESLKAAVMNGADAVYLGLNNFSARSKAGNFDLEQLKNAVNYAHLFGVSVYVAVNTIIKNSEIGEAAKLISQAHEAGADAFILQDFGLFETLKKELPDLEYHLSTQAGVHNSYGAKAAQKLGFKRIILSRETTLSDIRNIKKSTNAELEFFVQGAMCVSFSGNCYFSGLVSGYSGNRGKCLQLCRKKYEMSDGKDVNEGYWLSPKDLCLAEYLGQLIDAGVTSFKIEGRMRRPEYVAEAVKFYREAIDAYFKGISFDVKSKSDNLKAMYNRGDYCRAHLLEPTSNVIYPYLQGHTGLKIGKVSKVENGIAFVESNKTIRQGDGLKFVRNKIETGNCLVSTDLNRTTFSGDVKGGDEVFITSDTALIDDINKRTRKISVDCFVSFLTGQLPEISCQVNGETLSVKGGEPLEKALSAPVGRGRITEALEAFEDSEIVLNVKTITADDDIFIPISKIKNLRRALTEKIRNKLLISRNTLQKFNNFSTMSDILLKNSMKILEITENCKLLQFENVNIIDENTINFFDYLIYNPSVFVLEDISSFKLKAGVKAVLNLPNIARGKDLEVLEDIICKSGIENYIVNNLYGIELCKNKNILFGPFMNIVNSGLNLTAISSIENPQPDKNNITYVFGRFPIMTFTHCAKKSLNGDCPKGCSGYENFTLTDEKNNKFSLRRFKAGYCYAQMLNSLPVNIIKQAKSCGLNKTLFDTTGYAENDAKLLIGSYISGDNLIELKSTRGYFSKDLR